MAGKPQNSEVGPQGGTITLDAFFRSYNGGPLVDPDALPTVTIKDPNGIVQDTGTATKTAVGTYQYTYSIPLAAQISDEWVVEWSALVNGATVPNSSEYFRVVAAGSIGFGNEIIISDDWLNQIKAILAYPDVDNILLSDDNIKTLCVFESLDQYFHKFPIKTREQQILNKELTISFPDQSGSGLEVFGVLDVRAVDKFGSSTSSSFWDIVRFRTLYGANYGYGGTGFYKTPYNYNGLRQSWWAQKQTLDTFTNEATFKYFVNHQDQQLELYSSISAKVSITWASKSNDFNKVKHVYRWDVIRLSQAKLLRHLADTAGIVRDGSLDQEVNVSDLQSRAEKLEDDVWEKWNAIPDVILIRGT